jgi:hypothetical protein
MLGQICYKEFYENPDMEYQEVLPFISPYCLFKILTIKQAFVIHASHSSITIYYSKFPNSYLSEISRNGVRHSQKSKQGVKLQRTKKYRMRDTSERVELFQLLAKLLWYLISGKSHVGYLFNYADNPLHKIVHPQLCQD